MIKAIFFDVDGTLLSHQTKKVPETTKQALKELKHYGIKKEEIMAFGDGENDIEMLRYAKIGVAMGNAEEDVKEAADYVTDTVDADGIYKALQHFKVLKIERNME